VAASLTAAERSLRAQSAANTRWAHTDRRQASEDARERQLRRFEKLVDPDGIQSPEERALRAENARKAHMASLALKSAKARRLRREAAALDAEVRAS
jgi:hypothetical protein